jgi:hypothetical protein
MDKYQFSARCKFPIIAVYIDDIIVFETFDSLTICAKSDLNAGERGPYGKSTILDSTGLLWQMNGAKKIGGHGPMWGLNLFFNQTIRIEPIIVAEPSIVSVEIYREKIVEHVDRRGFITVHRASGCSILENKAAKKILWKIAEAGKIEEVFEILFSAE